MMLKKLLKNTRKEENTKIGVHNVGLFLRLIVEQYGEGKSNVELSKLIAEEFGLICQIDVIDQYYSLLEKQDYMDKVHWAVSVGLIEKPNYEY